MRRILFFLVATASAFLTVAPSAAAGPRRTTKRAAFAATPTDIVNMAKNQISNLRAMFDEASGVLPPPELEALQAAVEAEADDLGRRMYELLAVMTLDYKTDVETKAIEHLDDADGHLLEKTPELKAKMTYLYTYGMTMLTQGVLEIDTLKDLLVTKVASRVGMTGEELDAWLDVE